MTRGALYTTLVCCNTQKEDLKVRSTVSLVLISGDAHVAARTRLCHKPDKSGCDFMRCLLAANGHLLVIGIAGVCL